VRIGAYPNRGVAVSVREDRRSYVSVTGRLPSRKTTTGYAWYESLHEHDLFVLLEFDPTVIEYDPQPVTLKYRDTLGKAQRYTPDVLITYGREIATGPVLCEVKPLGELRKQEHRAKYQRDFPYARCYARERGWGFQVLNERHYRPPEIKNITFLIPYLEGPGDPEVEQRLLEALGRLEELREPAPVTLGDLLNASASSSEYGVEHVVERGSERAELMPIIWRVLADGRATVNLAEPIRLLSAIRRCDMAGQTRPLLPIPRDVRSSGELLLEQELRTEPLRNASRRDGASL